MASNLDIQKNKTNYYKTRHGNKYISKITLILIKL